MVSSLTYLVRLLDGEVTDLPVKIPQHHGPHSIGTQPCHLVLWQGHELKKYSRGLLIYMDILHPQNQN